MVKYCNATCTFYKGEVMMTNIEEVKECNPIIKSLSYKVKFEDGVFKFGFAEFIEEEKKIKVKAEFTLNIDEFKVYFESIISSIAVCNEETKRNIIKEICE